MEMYLLSPGMLAVWFLWCGEQFCKYVQGSLPCCSAMSSAAMVWLMQVTSVPSSSASQSLSVFVVICHAGIWKRFCLYLAVSVQALHSEFFFSYFEREVFFQRCWKTVYRNVGCMYCLFKVISTCSLCCDRTAEFGLFFCCVEVKHQNSGLKAVRSRPCLNLTSSCIFLTVWNFKLSFVKCSYTSN